MRLSPSIIAISSAIILSSCAPIALLGIGKGAQIVSQDRTAGSAVDDITIETTINHHFFRTDANDLFKNVDVDVIEGRVFLTGNVNKRETMVKAVDLSWEIKGVREVINEIQVENSSDIIDAAQDIWIEMQIEGELLITKAIKSTNYNVECVNGIVTLMGIAENDAELHLVTKISSEAAGVKQVISHVIMKDDARRIIPKADKPLTQ